MRFHEPVFRHILDFVHKNTEMVEMQGKKKVWKYHKIFSDLEELKRLHAMKTDNDVCDLHVLNFTKVLLSSPQEKWKNSCLHQHFALTGQYYLNFIVIIQRAP